MLYPLFTNPKFNASMNNSGLILVVQLHASVKKLKHKDLSQKTAEMSLLQITGSFIIT